MNTKKYFFLFMQIIVLISLCSADNAINLSIIRKMAESPDPNQKLEAVNSLENMIERGRLSSLDSDGVLSLLTFLATEGIINVKYDSFRIDNDHSYVRNEAVRVLGKIGHEGAVDSLVTVILNEPLTHVLSTAVISCGQLGISHKKMDSVFFLILTGKKEAYRSDTLVYNTLLAIKEIMKKDDSLMISGVLREGVIHVADRESGFLRKTRKMAEEILSDK